MFARSAKRGTKEGAYSVIQTREHAIRHRNRAVLTWLLYTTPRFQVSAQRRTGQQRSTFVRCRRCLDSTRRTFHVHSTERGCCRWVVGNGEVWLAALVTCLTRWRLCCAGSRHKVLMRLFLYRPVYYLSDLGGIADRAGYSWLDVR